MTRLAIGPLIEQRLTATWLQAVLYRTKTIPKLDEFLGNKTKPVDLEAKMKGLFMFHNRAKNG